jgi:hypothetical protein
MQKHTEFVTEPASQTYSSWYSIFSNAILETKRDRVLPQIERARNAIRTRMSELQTIPPDHSREPADLGDALRYLAILSRHLASDAGRILWD